MLPQKGLERRKVKVQNWNYGMSAIRINYNTNININDIDVSTYGAFGLTANLGHWVTTTSVGITEDNVDVQ